MGILTATGKGATSLVDVILKKFGNDVDGATQELVRMGGFPESVAKRIATGELPMDAESVAKRVQDQGHGNVVYRGINGEYDPDKAGYYQMFTTSKQDAAEYGDNLLEVRLNLGDNAVVDGRGRNFNSIPTEDGRLVRTDDLAHEAREAGRDSLTIRNIHDKADNEIPRRPASSNSGPSDEEIMRELGLDYSPSTSASPAPDARNYDPVDVDVVYDPSRIRSVNAAYDPQYTGPNIMGSAALPVAAGLLTAGQSEDADAGFVTRGGKTLLEAFHGSPHKFDKFSMDQIGTGEGAQAYGHGLYFADSEDVAREYRDRLSVGIDGNDSLTYKIGDSEYVRGDPEWKAIATIQNDGIEKAEELRQIYKNDLAAGEPYINADTVKRYSDALDRVNSGEEWSESAGALYRTEIDVTPESLLDWDKPLSEQSEAVRELAKYHNLERSQSGLKENTGAGLYQALGQRNAGADFDNSSLRGADRYANPILEEAGIKGIKYLDGDSRAAGDGTRNYVIFDDSLINIAERGNADPRLLAGVAGTTAAGLAAPGILNAPPVVAVGTPQADSGILSAQLNNHDQSVDQHMLNLGIDPRENPMYDYGTFLPVRQNIVTGKSEMAMPSFLRDTIRGLLDVAESRNSGVFRPDGLFEMI